MSGAKEYADALSKLEKDVRISEQQEAVQDYNTHLYEENHGLACRYEVPTDSNFPRTPRKRLWTAREPFTDDPRRMHEDDSRILFFMYRTKSIYDLSDTAAYLVADDMKSWTVD
jgi:hypothetical protein